MSEINNLKQLRALYADKAIVKAVLDHFADRERNYNIMKVDRLFSLLQEAGHSFARWELIDALKDLTNLGYGNFIVGRRGHPSRVEWTVGIVSLGKAAAGVADLIEPAEMLAVEEREDLLPAEEISKHTIDPSLMRVKYPLRPEYEIEVLIPKNLTRREAERFSDFFKTLPFEDAAAA